MDIIEGNPGSGKTYLAVKKIEEEQKDYYQVFTNIDNLQYDKFDSNVKQYDHKKFMRLYSKLYKMKVEDDLADAEILEYLIKMNITDKNMKKTLLIIDEAHNYFNMPSKILEHLVTYHRHYYFDIILITQSTKLINYKYLLLNYITWCVPQSKKLFNNTLTYKVYASDIRKNEESLVKTYRLKPDPKIFELYTSGDSVVSENMFKKYLYFAIPILFLFGFAVYSSTTGFQDLAKTGENVVVNEDEVSVQKLVKTVNNIDKVEKEIVKKEKIYKYYEFKRTLDRIQIKSLDKIYSMNYTYFKYLKKVKKILKKDEKKVVDNRFQSHGYFALFNELQYFVEDTSSEIKKRELRGDDFIPFSPS
jgi:nucleoside-triphosphatase THEP1